MKPVVGDGDGGAVVGWIVGIPVRDAPVLGFTVPVDINVGVVVEGMEVNVLEGMPEGNALAWTVVCVGGEEGRSLRD